MSESEFSIIHTSLLIYSGRNPRTEMRGLEEFAENIKEYGILEPIIVRPKEDKFEVVVGERRVRASILAGLKEIPAIIRAITDRQADELRLIENIHREDLTNSEKGDAILALLENYPDKYPTLKAIAQSLNMAYETLEDWVRASRKLSPFVKSLGADARITILQSRYLMKYDYATQDRLASKISEHNLNESQTVTFLKMYDQNMETDLDSLATQAKGVVFVRKLVEVPVEEYEPKKPTPPPQTKEIREKKSKTMKELAKRKREARKRAEKKPEPEDVEAKARELAEKLAGIEKPELKERMTQEATKGIEAISKRVEGAPEKSKKMEKKFARLRELEEKGLILYTIWDFKDRGDYAGHKDFVSNCSPQVVEQCVLRLTEKDDLILDPMAGSGTALDVFHVLGRRCIGFDIKPTRPDIRFNDSQTLPLESESIDMVFIHPPYWNLTTYTNAEENLPDLSRASTFEEYLKMLKQVFQECLRVLKPQKYMCVLLGDMVREGGFIPMCRKAANLAEEIGFTDCGFAVKIAHGEISRKKSGVIFAELAYTNYLKICHDLVMFFRKD